MGTLRHHGCGNNPGGAVTRPAQHTDHRPLPTQPEASTKVDMSECRRRRETAIVGRLLQRRDQLAASIAAHAAHDLPGVEALWMALHDLEESIADQAPALWRVRWPAWAAHDTERMHDPHGAARCPLRTSGSPRRAAQVAA